MVSQTTNVSFASPTGRCLLLKSSWGDWKGYPLVLLGVRLNCGQVCGSDGEMRSSSFFEQRCSANTVVTGSEAWRIGEGNLVKLSWVWRVSVQQVAMPGDRTVIVT